MIQICGLNSLSEAMLYFLGKANNNGVKKRIDEAIRQYPKYKNEIETVAKPAKAIEKLLDKELTADEAMVKKFFRNFDGAEVYSPFGFCLASVMLEHQLMKNLDKPLDKLINHLYKCSNDERLYSFCMTIAGKNGIYPGESVGTDKFLFYLEKLQVSAEDKLKIVAPVFDYKKSLDELFSIVLPAAKIIEASHEKYDEIINRFILRYSDGNARIFISSCFDDKLPHFKNIAVVPSLIGFDVHYAQLASDKIENLYNSHVEDDMSSDKTNPTDGDTESGSAFAYIFIGVLRHFISKASKNDIRTISNTIKAISDTTRLEILFYLCSHRPYAQELADEFGLSHSAVSYHITKLLAAGFVTVELSGGKTYYEADTENIQRMLDDFGSKIKHKSNLI